jgi:hypothetical protein
MASHTRRQNLAMERKVTFSWGKISYIWQASLTDFCTLKMEAIRSSETSVYTRSTRHHIPEDGILHSDRRENRKSFFNFLLHFILHEIGENCLKQSPLSRVYIAGRHII